MKQNKILVAFFVLILFSQISFTNTDNLAYAKYPVESWNFDVQSVSISARTIEPGSTIYITPTIRNSGSDTGTVLVYLGIQKPDGSKVYPDQKKIYDINPGYTEQITLEWDLPSSLQNGAYHVTIDVYNPQKNHMFDTTGFNYSFDVKKPEQFDFGISIDDDYDTVTAGDTARTTIKVYRQSGTSQHVRLSCAGFPSSELGCFLNGNRNQATITPTESVSLSVETGKYTTPRTYSITITGTGGDITRHEDFVLVVNEKQKEKSPVERPKEQTVTPDLNRDAPIGSVTVEHQAYLLKYRSSAMVQVYGEIENYQKGDPTHVTVKNPRGDSVMDMSLVSKDGTFHMPLMIDWSYTKGTYTVEISSRGNVVDSVTFDVVKDIPKEVVKEIPEIDAEITSFDLNSNSFKYGENVYAYVDVENTGNADHTFYVGFSIQDPSGDWIDVTPQRINLESEETGSVEFDWEIDNDISSGSYDVVTAVWENNDNGLDGRLDDSHYTFHVIDSNKPVVDVKTSPENPDTESRIEFEISVYDDGSEIKNVHLYLDGKIIKSWEKGGKLVYRTDKPLLEGEHMYSVMAEDVSGNVGIKEMQFSVIKETKDIGTLFGTVEINNEYLKYVEVNLYKNYKLIDIEHTKDDGTYRFDGLTLLSEFSTFNKYNIEVRLIDENNWFVIFDKSKDKEVVIKGDYVTLDPVIFSKNYSLQIKNTNDQIALKVYVSAVKGFEFYDKIGDWFDEEPLNIKIFDDSVNNPTYNFNKSSEKDHIQLPENMFIENNNYDNDKKLVLHEISHHVMHRMYGHDSFVSMVDNIDVKLCAKYYDDIDEFHTKYPKLNCNHHGMFNHDSADSVIEAFADFMSLVIFSEMDQTKQHMLYGSNIETMTTIYDKNIEQSMMIPEWYFRPEESIITVILWDFYDGKQHYSTNIDDDDIELGINSILSLFKNSYTLPKYYDNNGNCINDMSIVTKRHIFYLKDLYDVFIDSGLISNSKIDEIFDRTYASEGMVIKEDCRW